MAKVNINEQQIATHAAYLGGFFDVGGNLSIHANRAGFTVERVGFTDDVRRVEIFRENFGGSVSTINPHKRSRQWYLSGPNAIYFAREISPFAPSRKNITDYFAEFGAAMTLVAKKEIASKAKPSNRQTILGSTLDMYTNDLVEDPRFLAGVIDHRGRLQDNKRMRVQSKNGVLLKILAETYGGFVQLTSRRDEEKSILGHLRILRNHSYRWTVGSKVTAAIAAQVSGLLLLRRAEYENLLVGSPGS